uniref:ZZ-type domain-containing protein n=1 Tax=Odontella aurita TaxID=265563 RepID=A0A7S4JPN5_9STRA|mmetsp:Transcript_51126/g.153624  ORF Transcript_51126/g.153624 Transcript_51126/m.153624 type:complete len:491 (+) Transcript_51126:232-1704(+)
MTAERSSSWGDVILELYVDDEKVATIPMNMVMKATERDKPYYKSVVRCIVFANKLREANIEDDRGVGNVRHIRLSYRDDDGDEITFTTDAELREALDWAAESNRGRLTITADIPANMTRVEPFDNVLGAEQAKCSEAVNRNNKDGPLAFLFGARGRKRHNQTCNTRVQPQNNIFSFLLNGIGKPGSVLAKGEHTVSPIMPLQEESIEQKHEVHRNILKIVGSKGFVALARCPDGVKFDAKFIHKRHACDGCNQQPIIGYRYHALNAYNIDLCEACYLHASKLPCSGRSVTEERKRPSQDKTGDSLVFQLAQRKTDKTFKRVPRCMWLLGVDRIAHDMVGFVLKIASRRRIQEAPVLMTNMLPESMGSHYSEHGKTEEPILSVSDFDLQVAIQQSLRDLRHSTSLNNMDAGMKSVSEVTVMAACTDTTDVDDFHRHDSSVEHDVGVCMDEVALTSTDDEESQTSDQFEPINTSDLSPCDMVGFNDSDWCAL